MFTAEIRFRVLKRADSEVIAESVDGFVETLQRNGQVLSEEWPIAHGRAEVRTFVCLPEKSSLQRKFENKWTAERRKLLGEAGLSQPAYKILGREPQALDPCACKKPSAFILFTDYLSMESPLRCADCYDPVPLYRIPHTLDCETYEDIIFWRRNYQRCDALQMGCVVGERFCIGQMSRLNSELSRSGLECRRAVRKVTKVPCYYYLYRYNGRSKRAEAARKCPSCGRRWKLDKPWHGLFDFRCDRCHLVSNFALNLS